MREVLDEIRDGRFAREWVAEYAAGNSHYRALKQKDLTHPIEQVGAALRTQMSWLRAGEEVSREPASTQKRAAGG